VQSVDRVVDILETLAGSPAPLGVTEVARQVGLPQASTHRLLTALTSRGYARQDADRRYAVGAAALRLADRAYRELGAVATPYLTEAVRRTGETANLAVLEGGTVVYVAQSPSPHTLRIFAEVGRRVPVHSTAVGKVALAGLPPGQARRVLATQPLEARTPHTLTSTVAVLDAVARAGAEGYALDDEEQELGVRCLAVPVTHAGDLPVALSVSAPAERMSRLQAVALVPELQDVAAALAGALRPEGDAP
jgi:IclR family transcriptional regulator, acetate operon repressor